MSPTGKLLLLMCAPALAALWVVGQPSLRPWVLLADGVLLAIALLCLEAVRRLGGEFGPFGKGVL